MEAAVARTGARKSDRAPRTVTVSSSFKSWIVKERSHGSAAVAGWHADYERHARRRRVRASP
jgi:hypothetical protein